MNWCTRPAREFCPLWVIAAVLISGPVSAQDDFCSQEGYRRAFSPIYL